MSVFKIAKNPLKIAPVLFVQSMTLSVFSVLIGQSTLHFVTTGDVVGMSLLTVCTSYSQQMRLQVTPLIDSSSS